MKSTSNSHARTGEVMTPAPTVALTRFDPPGLLEDLNDNQKAQWSQWISDSMDRAGAGSSEGPRGQFYNPLERPTADDGVLAPITWVAFPKLLSAKPQLARWKMADSSRDRQDEYCEWSVTRGATGKITRVAFTCEGPEYWRLLARVAPEKLLELYRELASPDVKEEDLFGPQGAYMLRNRWNEAAAVHLVQEANTLSAEIEIAAAATVVRSIGGEVLTGEQELIRCGMYGVAGRNSDPHIGARVNSLARQRADVTLANPVGIYFDRLITTGWSTPDGSDPRAYWKYVRGAPGYPVRAVYEVPPDRPFVVGDIRIGRQPIDFGAQIADHINMKLVGLACRFNQSQVPPVTRCRKDFPRPGAPKEGPGGGGRGGPST
ncbi:hypothetical protein [Sorangium sp. So ce1153]|uniref:hypothetical protein n=1 Tax=Sorangium sp. So ce1153 TaxID=3133333 RepID=UPI003F6288D4